MGCGTDIIEISRIKKAYETFKTFKSRVFTERELLYFEKRGHRFETLAGMFAAKEAFAKAVGTGIGSISFRDIEICRDELGAPYIKLRGIRQNVSLSISHCREYAVAVVTENAPQTGDRRIGADISKSPYSDNIRTDAANGEIPTTKVSARLHLEHFSDSAVYRGNHIPFEHILKMRDLIPARADDANKGTCGRVVIIAGSVGMTGAAALSALGALRSGAGLVTVMTPACEQPVLAVKLTEAMTVPLPHENGVISEAAAELIAERVANADAVVFGPGLGKGRGILQILKRLLSEFEKTLVIDADGINALSLNIDILCRKRCNVILTPHPGEMSRLTGLSVPEIQADRVAVAERFARKFDVTLALKGKGTVIAARDKEHTVNPSGNSGMATGGTGDVLSGIIASLAAQGCNAYDATVLGVYLHGRAGDLAALQKGVHGLIASDLCNELPAAISETLNSF